MNKRVIAISIIMAILLLSTVSFLFKYEYDSMLFTEGTGYALFDITKIELTNSSATIGSSTNILRGTPFWFYYETSSSLYLSILPLMVDFLLMLLICLLVTYSLYKLKFKQMHNFKKEHKREYIPYENMWNFVEPTYYDIDMVEGYRFEELYRRRTKNKKKKK